MNTEHEIQLSDDLRHLVAGQSFEADITTIERRGRKARKRSRMVRGLAGLGALAVAAGGVTIGLHFSTASTTNTAGPAHPTSTKASSSAPKVETAAYVVQQAQAALNNETNFIIQDDTVNNGEKYTIWTDPQTGHSYLLEGTGSAKQESWQNTYLVNNVLHWKETDLDYSTDTWFVLVQSAGGPIQGPAPSAPYAGAGGTTTEIKELLNNSHVQIVGHGESNGHQVIKLQLPWANGYRQIWVDSQTYQPVHIVQADFANSSGPLKNDMIVTDESWIPRTPDLVNLTNNPRIPTGFRQVPPPK